MQHCRPSGTALLIGLTLMPSTLVDAITPTVSLAFGSCNKQWLPQSFWPVISDKASSFLWLGDAVYSKDNTLSELLSAYTVLASNSYYDSFKQKVGIDGVWDDHDFGVNDGGAEVSQKTQRQRAFLDFVFGKGDKFAEDASAAVHLRQLNGLYHSKDYGNIKVIFLDTRSHRALHWIPSVGVIKFPLTSLIAAALRSTYSLLGYGRDYSGDVLGEEQWLWFESTLLNSQAAFHIIVSSVQVLTTNPAVLAFGGHCFQRLAVVFVTVPGVKVESWGHFPSAKRRLLEMLAIHDPSGLVLLSGDVHMAEISAAKMRRDPDMTDAQPSERLIEITSSGLTHSCREGIITHCLCPAMVSQFANHRLRFDTMYTGKNFGIIQELPGNQNGLNISVLSLEDLEDVHVVLSHQVYPHPPSMRRAITSIEAEDFRVSLVEVLLIYMIIFGAVCFVLCLCVSCAHFFNAKRQAIVKSKWR